MNIIINIKEPVPHGTDIIGIKEAVAYVLEIHDLTVGMIDIQDADQSESVKKRYAHNLKVHGEHSDFVAGFRDCMSVVERSEK